MNLMSDPKFLIRKDGLFLEAKVIGADILSVKRKIKPSSMNSFGSDIISVTEGTKKYARREYFKKSFEIAKQIGADYILLEKDMELNLDTNGYHLRCIANYFVKSKDKTKSK